jgi:hypothetical protein
VGWEDLALWLPAWHPNPASLTTVLPLVLLNLAGKSPFSASLTWATRPCISLNHSAKLEQAAEWGRCLLHILALFSFKLIIHRNLLNFHLLEVQVIHSERHNVKIVFFFFWCIWSYELRASHLQSRCSAA